MDFQSIAMTASAKPPYTIMGNEILNLIAHLHMKFQYLLATGINLVIVSRNKFTVLVNNVTPGSIVPSMVVT